MVWVEILVGFLISLLVSGLIIYLVTKLLGEREGFGTAILTALTGSIIFALVSYFLGTGWIAVLLGGIAWLIALGTLYNMGWLKSLLVAFIVWIFANFVNLILPTIGGPL